MQGSCKYETLNDPVRKPQQQIDMDYGVFMPTEFMVLRSGNQPILASKGYFRAVEALLDPLCKEKGWKLKSDTNSCVRIEISNEAHIDLPLYAVPSDQFHRLTEDLAKSLNMAADAVREESELSDLLYRQLPMDEIMLAHREKGWHSSDPRQIEDWFRQAVDTYGPVLRRICRYLKAWRDLEWQTSKPKLSSLAIMACVVDILDHLSIELPNSRDDLALLLVCERLADRLGRRIPNPVLADQRELDLDCEWKIEDRNEIVLKAGELRYRLHDALKGTDSPSSVLAHLRSALGNRMTNDVAVIRVQTNEAAVRSFPKAVVAAPVVGRTTSG
jgi:hypothetical protein